MSVQNHIFIQTLKKQGYNLTAARQAVFVAMENAEPQSMQDLLTRLNAIDRASVYRTIALFEKLGIVQRIQMGWKYKLELTDTFHYHHHHISCTSCETIVPIREDASAEAAIRALATDYGFEVTDHQLEIQGLCGMCRNLKNPGVNTRVS